MAGEDYGPTPTAPAAPKKALPKPAEAPSRKLTRSADSEAFTDQDLALETKGPIKSQADVTKNLSRQTSANWRDYQQARAKAERVLSNKGRKFTTGR